MTNAIMPALRPCKVRPASSGANPCATTIIATLIRKTTAEATISRLRPSTSASTPATRDDAVPPASTAATTSDSCVAVSSMVLFRYSSAAPMMPMSYP